MDTLSADDLKPPVPYVKGWRFTARAHIPPPPTPVTIDCCLNDKAGELEWKQLSPVERCLLHPPLPGSDGSFSVELEIDRPLRVGDNHNAQVALVRLLKCNPHLEGLAKGSRLVAKIYDPLYFFDNEGYVNPFLAVDKHYTHETAAYAALSDLQGSMIPKYYGSFSLDIPVGSSTTRCVRLILIEFIPGLSMRDADPKSFSQRARQQIMKAMVDFDTLLYSRDIIYSDLHPRNVMLTNTARSDEQRPVIFIDFGDARFHVTKFHGTYISPLLRWHEAHRLISTFDFDSWVDWDWQSWLQEEYGHTAASITEEMRDWFLPDSLLNPLLPWNY